VISDDIPELLQICNRMLVMRDGRLADEIITADITLSELEKQIVQTA
jgi:simple sugar transport system ATP-binding protein